MAGTITFLLYWHLFQAYILLHRKLRLEQIMLRNSKLSLAKSPFWNSGTIYHLCKLGLYSQIGEQPSYRFLVSTHIHIIYVPSNNVKSCHTNFCKILQFFNQNYWHFFRNALLWKYEIFNKFFNFVEVLYEDFKV